MQNLDENIKIAWEKRSLHYGKKPEGVLPKSLPRLINNYLDDWMYQQIKLGTKNFVAIKNKKIKVLDVGCGYGRLSSRIVKDFPKTYISGVDIAQHYVDLYNQNLHHHGVATKADVRKLPFKKNTFDLVFVVTTLMYVLENIDQKKAIKECLRVLKDNGCLVIIEPNPIGHQIVTVGGLVTKIRGKKQAGISSVGYTAGKMTTLIKQCRGNILTISGMPFWTLSLPFSIFLSYFNIYLAKKFLSFVGMIDKKFSRLLTPSLYISYTCTKSRQK